MLALSDRPWYYNTRFVGQAAKTPPSHGGNTGSIPVRTAKIKSFQYTVLGAFYFCKLLITIKPLRTKS